MKTKQIRLQNIIEVISLYTVGSQSELAELLSKRGIVVTQATLSRDLKTLCVTKVPTDRGGYMYIMPNSNEVQDAMLSHHQTKPQSRHNVGFVSINFSGNIAVIKTRNGYATALAYDIDMSNPEEILGTIAGADTVFAIMRENASRDAVLAALKNFISANLQKSAAE